MSQTTTLWLMPRTNMAALHNDRKSFNEALIAIVAKTPAIWDVTREDHKNGRHIALLWDNIAKYLNTTAKHASDRWRNLKDTFRKQLRKVDDMKNGGGTAKMKRIRWPYFQQLQFLLPVITSAISQGSSANLTVAPTDYIQDDNESVEDNEEMIDESQYSLEGEMTPDEEEEEEEGEEEEEENTSIVIEDEPSVSFRVKCDPLSTAEPSMYDESPHNSTSFLPPDSSTKRKRSTSGDHECCLLKQLQQMSQEVASRVVCGANKQQPDPIEYFLLSLAPSLRETPPELLPSLQMHIIYIISKYRKGIVPTDLPNVTL